MKVFRYHPPYKPSGRTSFPETAKRSGVYLIKENDKLVYIGVSLTDLYKTLYRHFQTWNDINYRTQKVKPPSDRVTYKNRMKRNRYTVRIVFCPPGQAARLERALIIKYQPRDNDVKYSQYTLTLADTKCIKEYDFEPVEQECPF
ncbi:hypothetical protein DYU05_03895 [Mucilaginibacter terrenus]|uniref:GIY-YIG domain-containing protein n=1 Tax=Mucilaginibacter terrenus TaxID=2482727 RepID=A0A3E2NUX6_9SPHI|nr:GIY-YIG nuclease family protein [Mucilaginibacter terrenus]RFZ84757.1 hypothetical protein DYU05_03895 [Mucilaginibacter terrenus]